MWPQNREADNSPPPATFVGWVQLALEQLHDMPLLQRHPLVKEWQTQHDQPAQEITQHLRAALIAAIQSQKPATDVPSQAQQNRIHRLLHLHYIEGITVQKAATKLNVSLRQAYRDLRRGEESVAMLLWGQRPATAQRPNLDDTLASQARMERLETQPFTADVRRILERAHHAVEKLAHNRLIDVVMNLPGDPVILSIDPSAAHQVFISLLSHAIQHSQPGRLEVTLDRLNNSVCLAVHFSPPAGTDTLQAFDPVIEELANRLGWSIAQEPAPEGNRIARLCIPGTGPRTVLVIDDNEGLGRLLERYLTGESCQIIQATTGLEGLRMAQAYAPSAIVLDIMMPNVDGWEILQTLRNQPRTATVPVIICSVLNDPELALSLGAAMVLRKPFTRDDVLNTFHQLGI